MLLEYLKILGIDNMPEEIIKYLDAPSIVRLKNVGYFCGKQKRYMRTEH